MVELSHLGYFSASPYLIFHMGTNPFMKGGWHDHKVTSNDPTWAKHPWQLQDLARRERLMDAINV